MSKTTSNERARIARQPFITIGAAIGCSLSLSLIFLVLLFVVIFPGRNNAHRTCQAALDVRDAVSFILKDAQRESPETVKANQFYARAFIKLKDVRCHS